MLHSGIRRSLIQTYTLSASIVLALALLSTTSIESRGQVPNQIVDTCSCDIPRSDSTNVWDAIFEQCTMRQLIERGCLRVSHPWIFYIDEFPYTAEVGDPKPLPSSDSTSGEIANPDSANVRDSLVDGKNSSKEPMQSGQILSYTHYWYVVDESYPQEKIDSLSRLYKCIFLVIPSDSAKPARLARDTIDRSSLPEILRP